MPFNIAVISTDRPVSKSRKLFFTPVGNLLINDKIRVFSTAASSQQMKQHINTDPMLKNLFR
jgi:hypothetical protein